MRKSGAFLTRSALVAGVTLAGWQQAGAADGAVAPFQASDPLAARGGLSPAAVHDAAIALRAQWLARGHSVQQLAALAPPTITGGSVTASTITVGAAGEFPSMSLSYSTDTPGLSFVEVEFSAPNGKTGYGGGYATYDYTQSGTLSFAIVNPVSLYALPGKWSLTGATIYDNAGNSTTYTASQLKALFTSRSFTVVNTGLVDKAAPRITGGKLLNDTVSLSAQLPTLAATITASSGKGPGINQAFVWISPPGGGYSYYDIFAYPRPVRAGNIKANNVFGASSPTGTWSIVGFGVCDYASNCSGSTSDADVVALFGTDTFTVTP